MDDVYRGRPFTGCLIITIVVFGCIVSTVFAADRVCSSALNWRVSIYPKSTILSQTYNFLSANGMGETFTVLYVPATRRETERWYNVEDGRKANEAASDPLRGAYHRLTNYAWQARIADDKTGTNVYIRSSCLQGDSR